MTKPTTQVLMADLGRALLRSASLRREFPTIPMSSVRALAPSPALSLVTDNRHLKKAYRAAARAHFNELVSDRDHAQFWELVVRHAPKKNCGYQFPELDDIVTRCYPGLPTYSVKCVEPIGVLYQMIQYMALDDRTSVDYFTGSRVRLTIRMGDRNGYVEATDGRLAVEVRSRGKCEVRYQRDTNLWQGQSADTWWRMPVRAYYTRLGPRAASAAQHMASKRPEDTHNILMCLALAQRAGAMNSLLGQVNWDGEEAPVQADVQHLKRGLVPLLNHKSHLTIRQQFYTLVVPHLMNHDEFVSVFGDPLDRFRSHLSVDYIDRNIHRLLPRIS